MDGEYVSAILLSIAIAAIAIDNLVGRAFNVGVPTKTEPNATLLATLTDVENAARANVERSLLLQERARMFRERLSRGESIVDLVENEDPPRMVELLTNNMTALETAGAAFRAAEAHALRSEGLTLEAIAKLFGVTRQRISALLRQSSAVQR